ncbi:MAG: hypothetical protein JSS60_00625 [Verrucomicrobia bacterium]|nr:hypothetical protein [Verrucomicrobiota bacterium]
MVFSFDRTAIAFSLLTACSLSFSSALYSDTPSAKPAPAPKQDTAPTPWLTGPLLTPSGHVIPKGHYNIEPYEFITTNYGLYDANWHTHDLLHNFYNLSTQIPVQIGLPASFDFTFVPAWSWNHTDGASHWDLNDMGVAFDYQILNDKKGTWWPAIKLNFGGNLPIGRYQKLDPKDKGTDVGGTGSWLPTVGIVMSHLYWWGGHFFFAPRFNVQYTVPTPVHVKNFNAYGGGHHTRGKVFPGQVLKVLFGFEIAVSQRWALAGDIQYQHINKTRFSGHKGATAGVPNVVGAPSSESLSLAPAIEYNWSANYGVIAGAWFTVAGRNTPEFASAVIAVNIYH